MNLKHAGIGTIVGMGMILAFLMGWGSHPKSTPKPHQAQEQNAQVSLREIQSAHLGVLVGTQGPLLTIFVSPNCPYCADFYIHLRPFIDQGKVRARFILVGGGDEAVQAAGVISSKQPMTELGFYFVKNLHMNPFQLGLDSEGDYVFTRPTLEAQNQVTLGSTVLARSANNTLLTPSLLFCDAKGVHWKRGELNNDELNSFLPTLPASNTPCG